MTKERGEGSHARVELTALASGSQTVLVVGLLVAGCIGVVSIVWGSGAAIYVGLGVTALVAVLCLVFWRHSHQGADDHHGQRFHAPEVMLEASEERLSIRGPASTIGAPDNYAAALKLAQRVVNKKPLPPAHGHMVETSGQLQAVEFTESERAADHRQERAEANRLNAVMRAKLIAPKLEVLESPHSAGNLPSLASHAHEVNAVQADLEDRAPPDIAERAERKNRPPKAK